MKKHELLFSKGCNDNEWRDTQFTVRLMVKCKLALDYLVTKGTKEDVEAEVELDGKGKEEKK